MEIKPLTKEEVEKLTTAEIIQKSLEIAKARNFHESVIWNIERVIEEAEKKPWKVEELQDFLMNPMMKDRVLEMNLTTL